MSSFKALLSFVVLGITHHLKLQTIASEVVEDEVLALLA